MSNAGGTLEFSPGTAVSNEFWRTNTYRNSLETISGELRQQISAQARSNTIDPGRLSITHNVPFSTTSRDITYGPKLRALFGGIQANSFFIRNFRIRPINGGANRRLETFDYSAEIRFVLYDEFGVGADDLYQEGLVALWILQHQRSGRPFTIKATIDHMFYGRY